MAEEADSDDDFESELLAAMEQRELPSQPGNTSKREKRPCSSVGPAPPADIQPVKRRVTEALRRQLRDARAEATARARQLHSQLQQSRTVCSSPNPASLLACAAAPSQQLARHSFASSGDEQERSCRGAEDYSDRCQTDSVGFVDRSDEQAPGACTGVEARRSTP